MAVPKHKVSKIRIRRKQQQSISFLKKSFNFTRTCVYCKITNQEIFSLHLSVSNNLICRGCINNILLMKKRKKKTQLSGDKKKKEI